MLVNFLNNSTMFTFVICFSFGDLYGLFCDVKVKYQNDIFSSL